jgi:hypothetical protein
MVSSRLDTAGFLARSSSGDPEPRREYALTPAGDGRRDCRAKRGARAQQRGAIVVVEPQLPASETSRCAQRWCTVATIVPVFGAAASSQPARESIHRCCMSCSRGRHRPDTAESCAIPWREAAAGCRAQGVASGATHDDPCSSFCSRPCTGHPHGREERHSWWLVCSAIQPSVGTHALRRIRRVVSWKQRAHGLHSVTASAAIALETSMGLVPYCWHRLEPFHNG